MSEALLTAGENPKNSLADEDENIISSPFKELAANVEIPVVPLPDFMLEFLEKNYDVYKDQDWVSDVVKGTSCKFGDIKPMSTKIASALTRLGFKKGDVLFFVTYDVALIYMIEFSVWRCGGAVRGCFQRENKEEFERQMRETDSRFILCDPETAEPVKWASERLGWPVTLLSIGRVEGATDVEEMIEGEDGSAFPHDVKINPKEDVLAIPNTSGSTGLPKGIMHTHFNLVGMVKNLINLDKIGETRKLGMSQMGLMANYAVGPLMNIVFSVFLGCTFHTVSKFNKNTFLDQIMKCKPETLFLFPYVTNWLIRLPDLEDYDLSFIKHLGSGGSVLDSAAAKIIEKRLPAVNIVQSYASSEALAVTTSSISDLISSSDCEKIAGIKCRKVGDEVHISCGHLLTLVEAKIVDPEKGCTVGRMVPGILHVKNPYLMKGYLNKDNDKGFINETINGWLNTEDMAFFDEDDTLFILDRRSFMFKYLMHHVSPAELESVVGEHPAVLSVGVVGVPDSKTTYAARAYVVLKPGYKVTEEEIKRFVAERKVFYKHLHGGVEFVDHLPESQGGKLDRKALLQMAITEQNS